MIQNKFKEGKIVPSEVTIKLLQRAIMQENSNDKFLIDGFPRNEENRAAFELVTGIEPKFVLFFDCPEEEMEKRLLGIYQGREYDNIETIRKRFNVYMESSLPVIEHYNSRGKINAAKPVEEVFEAVKVVFSPANENKVAVITGGASGIGEETARCFAMNGVRALVIADIQEEKGQKVAESIGLDRCLFIKCDVTDEEQVKSLVDSTIKLYGQIDIMFSNAGIVSPCKQDILDFSFAASDRLFAINVRGMIACVKHAGKAMVDGGVKGSIICTASTAATHGFEDFVDYTMSKHAVLGLVRCASKGLGGYGIRVNCVSPGPVPTPLACLGLNINSLEEFEKHYQHVFTLKHNKTMMPSHISDAVLFLASGDSEFITGHNLVVDAGQVPGS